MVSRRIKKMYPNIIDMIAYSPIYSVKRGHNCNTLILFWNYLGARGKKPYKYECDVCGEPIQKRRPRKYMICQKCIRRYIVEVEQGKRTPIYHVMKVAA